jgi:hypothetical protein
VNKSLDFQMNISPSLGRVSDQSISAQVDFASMERTDYPARSRDAYCNNVRTVVL